MVALRAAFRTQAWRTAISYIALILVTMGIVSAYLATEVRNNYLDNLRTQLAVDARMVSREASGRLPASPGDQRLGDMARETAGLIGGRVTIIGADGAVLADSGDDPLAMENHAGRPEVRDAMGGGIGISTRVSSTLGRELMYVAVPVAVQGNINGVARVALSTDQINTALSRMRFVILLAAGTITVLAAGLAIVIARRTTRAIRVVTRSARRLAAGELDQKAEVDSPDEAGELAKAFNDMAGSLKRMVADLGSEKDKLAAVLSTMSEGTIMTTGDGTVALANPAAEQLLGTPLPVGQRLIELDRDYELHRLLKECSSTGMPQQGEIELRRARRYLAVTATPIASEAAGAALLVLHDITDLRRVERTRREFVANVSHELRTPLTSIRAAVDTLEEGALEDRAATGLFLKRISSEVERMSRLVADLLELSRLESGQVSPVLSPVHLNALAVEAAQRLFPMAEAKQVTLSTHISPDTPPVPADRERMLQVLSNLLDNAIKFTPSGGNVTLFAKRHEDTVVLTVADTGIGIPAEHLPHIFERFYKVEKSRSSGGTGLGLAIARHIVLAHGGQIFAESEEGRGSSFTFTLPFTR
ncbi:MAG: HAMP domain-containing protein [Chloroflexi bacterium]|nr:HAMP domain-containing protein [Chloroflexota bacterium]